MKKVYNPVFDDFLGFLLGTKSGLVNCLLFDDSHEISNLSTKTRKISQVQIKNF